MGSSPDVEMTDFSEVFAPGRLRQIVLSISAFLACIIIESPVAELNGFGLSQTLVFGFLLLTPPTYHPMDGHILFHQLSRRLSAY